jgi:hypothetical protein
MSGLFLVAVVGLWVWLIVKLSKAIGNSITQGLWRWPIAVLTFLVLLVLPVADEIVGGFQFRALCEKNAVFRIGVDKPEGRVTRLSINPSNEIVPGTAITIYHTGMTYTDVQSGEVVVQLDRYVAKGGIFIRTLGISQDNAPITMDRSWCSPEQARGEAVNRTLKFSVIN